MTARRRFIAGAIGLGCLTALASALPLQEGAPAPPVEQDDPHEHEHDHGVEVVPGEDGPTVQLPVPGMDDAQQEMIRLFGRVERNLRKIDVLLSDAGAGDTEQLANVGEAGIGLLLNRSLESGREALKDIDRILELAASMSPPPSSCPDCAAGT